MRFTKYCQAPIAVLLVHLLLAIVSDSELLSYQKINYWHRFLSSCFRSFHFIVQTLIDLENSFSKENGEKERKKTVSIINIWSLLIFTSKTNGTNSTGQNKLHRTNFTTSPNIHDVAEKLYQKQLEETFWIEIKICGNKSELMGNY